MYLLDTNIFLEIHLAQNKKEICKKFIKDNTGSCSLSDFTLYSIGIVLFRSDRFEDYVSFYNDISGMMSILSLPDSQHPEMTASAKKIKFDFDDSYQYQVAKFYKKTIVTMDNHFKRVKDVPVIFL